MSGAIVASVLNNGGSDYSAGDTGNVHVGANLTAEYVVDAVNGFNSVTAYTITIPGSGYVVSSAVDTQALTGIGFGFTIDITEVTADPSSGYHNSWH